MKKIRLTVTALFSIIILFTAFIVFFKLQTEAANRSTGDLKVTGGSYGEDYRYENNTLVILSDKPVTISGETKKIRSQSSSSRSAVQQAIIDCSDYIKMVQKARKIKVFRAFAISKRDDMV